MMKTVNKKNAGVLVLILLIAACSGSKADPKLEQAVKSIKYMTSSRFLSRSAFRIVYPDQTPSGYINYIFSTMGTAEWPTAFDKYEEEQLRSINAPVMPKGVAVLPHQPDPEQGLQVVLRADDANGVIIVEAYETGSGEPVITLKREISTE